MQTSRKNVWSEKDDISCSVALILIFIYLKLQLVTSSNKLANSLAVVAWDSVGGDFAADICIGSSFIWFIVTVSVQSSLNRDKMVAS